MIVGQTMSKLSVSAPEEPFLFITYITTCACDFVRTKLKI